MSGAQQEKTLQYAQAANTGEQSAQSFHTSIKCLCLLEAVWYDGKNTCVGTKKRVWSLCLTILSECFLLD